MNTPTEQLLAAAAWAAKQRPNFTQHFTAGELLALFLYWDAHPYLPSHADGWEQGHLDAALVVRVSRALGGVL